MKKKFLCSYIGQKFKLCDSYTAIVTDGGSRNNYLVVRVGNWIKQVHIETLKKGTIRHPFYRTVVGTGYIGGEKYSKKTDKECYAKWYAMLVRGYNKTCKERQPTYKNATVCSEWHNFQSFAKWYYKNYPKIEIGKKWELDKDLFGNNSKVYSPETCIFLPKELNCFLSNIRRNNTSGVVGVCFSKSMNKWMAYIYANDRIVHLGYYSDKKQASVAYKVAREERVKFYQEKYKDVLPKKALDRLA